MEVRFPDDLPIYSSKIESMSGALIDIVGELTGQSVVNVFNQMLAMSLLRDGEDPLAPDSSGQIVGSVGFAGQANGIVYLYSGFGFARIVTSQMLGLNEADGIEDEMVKDAIGELSNMVVGNIKSHLCDAGWECTLTIPSILRGSQIAISGTGNSKKKILGFRNQDHRMLAHVVIKENSG